MAPVSQPEFTIKELTQILPPVVGHGRKITYATMSFYQKEGFIYPRGSFLNRARRRWTFPDVVALGFLLDLSGQGFDSKYGIRQVEKIQARKEFPSNLVVVGQMGRLMYRHETGLLALALLNSIKICQEEGTVSSRHCIK